MRFFIGFYRVLWCFMGLIGGQLLSSYIFILTYVHNICSIHILVKNCL